MKWFIVIYNTGKRLTHDISSRLSWLIQLPQASAQRSTARHQRTTISPPTPSLLGPTPDMPGVWRATASKSTPGAKFLPLAWTFRISYRPWTSGGSTWSTSNLTSRRDPNDPSSQESDGVRHCSVNGSLWKLRISRHSHSSPHFSFPPCAIWPIMTVIPTEWPRLPTWIWRSKRPGRTNAWSRMSARFVAAITTSQKRAEIGSKT